VLNFQFDSRSFPGRDEIANFGGKVEREEEKSKRKKEGENGRKKECSILTNTENIYVRRNLSDLLLNVLILTADVKEFDDSLEDVSVYRVFLLAAATEITSTHQHLATI